ncbi:hypothetical protein GLOTRDRAFT_69926 [Gloeophyllum trabeum ATCC 11539]|uniref:BTB domain-containing protein n=1 Tax=Gloeophyllum trabeum (strain ATCC 11539 / FP-39264 / Madison 617) TaxID=670483 RepID=S7QG95_GLOTA|nr:uncharacterized protein GLOTRDRAFT_69926 [Gloeophyllum trabeum ATCC 11539]EPQ58911.1 hypothetical protein GLOTRDRAFT_69926 [Gloeophyllum trabeum ATCC 11539]
MLNAIKDPWNSPDADIILICAPDETDIRLHKCILSAASPFFENMFSLPQPSCSDTPLPVVHISEASSVMETVLQFVYPMLDPDIGTLDELAEALAVAMKYELTVAIHALRKLLVSPRFVEKEPMKVFAIACRFDLDDEAKVASRHTLSTDILATPLSDDLKHISAYSYRRLLDLHRTRAAAAQEVLQSSKPGSVNTIKCMQCSAVAFGSYMPPRWWTDFEKRGCEELAVRPCTRVIFSMAFLSQSARSGCPRCAESVLNSYVFIEGLKKRIDELPDTI